MLVHWRPYESCVCSPVPYRITCVRSLLHVRKGGWTGLHRVGWYVRFMELREGRRKYPTSPK